MQKETYNTLEDLQLRRDELSDAIDKEGEHIMELWHSLYKKEEDTTRGEYIVSIINNSITAIDAFLLVRKLFRSYNHLFDFLNPSKKKRSRRSK